MTYRIATKEEVKELLEYLGKERSRSSQRWQKANPEKASAIRRAGYAVAVGRLVRPKLCSLCYKESPLHGHLKRKK